MNSGQPVTSPSVPPPLEYTGLLPAWVCLLVVAGDMASVRLSGNSDLSRATALFHFNDQDQINHCHWRELEGRGETRVGETTIYQMFQSILQMVVSTGCLYYRV